MRILIVTTQDRFFLSHICERAAYFKKQGCIVAVAAQKTDDTYETKIRDYGFDFFDTKIERQTINPLAQFVALYRLLKIQMKFKPVLDWILIEPEEETKEINGLRLPDTARNKPSKAHIIAVGTGHITDEGKIPFEVKVGDYILFEKDSGQPITDEETNKEYLFIKEQNILSILETE